MTFNEFLDTAAAGVAHVTTDGLGWTTIELHCGAKASAQIESEAHQATVLRDLQEAAYEALTA